jgi:FMN-dependent NADH-azoreductase
MTLNRQMMDRSYYMATLLKIDSSPMGERSISRKLTAEFANTWMKAHPGGTVISRDLTALEIPVVNSSWVGAAYTPEEARTAEQKKVLGVSDLLIGELQQADEYVVGVPMHNFSVPSTLKLWIDQVMRAGKTFSYGASGAKGLLTGKKATLLMASGGVYENGGAMAAFNFVTPYLRTVFGFVGITDITFIAAEGTNQLNTGTIDPQAFLAPSLEKVQAQASL